MKIGLEVKQRIPVEMIKRKMYASMSKNVELSKIYYRKGYDTTLQSLLIGRHSPINVMIFEVSGWVKDRSHNHLRTHRDIQRTYWCGTSRVDIDYGEKFVDDKGEVWRFINFDLSLDALIHISQRRLCPTAHEFIRADWESVKNQCIEYIPELEPFCTKPCVWTGFCTEVRYNCGYIRSPLGKKQRRQIMDLSRRLTAVSSESQCY